MTSLTAVIGLHEPPGMVFSHPHPASKANLARLVFTIA